MTQIDIVSGFLGAGKTTLIKKLLKEVLTPEKTVLIENEFGEIGIDGGFLKEAGIEIREMNSGCICCSLVGDFGASLKEVFETYKPERILIEPSGVGKLSDVIKAVEEVMPEMNGVLSSASVVVDASKCKMYLKNFGEFFVNQVEHAHTILFSRTDKVSEKKLEECIALIRQHNSDARLVTTPWDKLDGDSLFTTMTKVSDTELEAVLLEEVQKEGCGCGGHHGHGEGKGCGCGGHHGHGEEEGCGCGGHHHHGDHHADEVFTSWGVETAAAWTEKELIQSLELLEDEKRYGMVLRAKGMLDGGDGTWLYFDYVPGERQIRKGRAEVIGKICVIGSGLEKDELASLFERKGETE